MSRHVEIEAEIRRRAAWHLKQTHLCVDYYRIRRRVAYPLPIRAIHRPDTRARQFGRDYPWSIWMAWALEERMACLGAMAEWFQDSACAELAARDLEALSSWPVFRQLDTPDLALGHSARMLWRGYHRSGTAEGLRASIRAAFSRIVEDVVPLSDRLHGTFVTKHDVLALDKPHAAVHNIPIIGAIGAALAAHEIGHPASRVLNVRLLAILGALLDLREQGLSEGVAYDGYVLDFLVDWLGILSVAERAALLHHPRFGDFFEQSCMLAVPGDAHGVAEFGDVEPRQMGFHLSAQAKLQAMKADPVRAWHLDRCDPAQLRAEALVVLRGMTPTETRAPAAGVLDAHYALVLRNDWEAGSLAVAMAASNSPMGHIHHDAGSLVIGGHGRWLVADPGYQQYMSTREREFTVGVAAHNAPVINGRAQDGKAMRHLKRENSAGRLNAELDITGCYPSELKLTCVRRALWLVGRVVVVRDRVEGASVESIRYHWHGHAETAWGVESPWACLYCPDEPGSSLWITSPQARIEESGMARLPGSRGQVTLTADAEAGASVVWWVFAQGERLAVRMDGAALRVGDLVLAS